MKSYVYSLVAPSCHILSLQQPAVLEITAEDNDSTIKASTQIK